MSPRWYSSVMYQNTAYWTSMEPKRLTVWPVMNMTIRRSQPWASAGPTVAASTGVPSDIGILSGWERNANTPRHHFRIGSRRPTRLPERHPGPG